MTILTVPPDAPAPDVPGATNPSPAIAIFANLLPDEIVAARRLTELKRKLAIGLAALVAMLVLAYGFSWWQTHSANDDLADQQHGTTSMQAKLQTYAPLVTAQAESASIQSTLGSLMANDLQWRNLITDLHAQAAGLITIETVSADITQPTAGVVIPATAAGLPVLNESGGTVVGTLSVDGTAKDKNSIAAFVDRLSKVKGLAAPLPASITGVNGVLTFSVDMLITSQRLGGRYTVTTSAPALTGTSSTGGK